MSTNSERLRRIERSIAELQADGRPARLKEGLLTALRRERDSLKASMPQAPMAEFRVGSERRGDALSDHAGRAKLYQPSPQGGRRAWPTSDRKYIRTLTGLYRERHGRG